MFIMLSFLPLFCDTGVKIYEMNLNFLSRGNVVDFRQKSLSVTDLSVVIISCVAELLLRLYCSTAFYCVVCLI